MGGGQVAEGAMVQRLMSKVSWPVVCFLMAFSRLRCPPVICRSTSDMPEAFFREQHRISACSQVHYHEHLQYLQRTAVDKNLYNSSPVARQCI